MLWQSLVILARSFSNVLSVGAVIFRAKLVYFSIGFIIGRGGGFSIGFIIGQRGSNVRAIACKPKGCER